MSGNKVGGKPDWSIKPKIKGDGVGSQVDITKSISNACLDKWTEINRILRDIKENYRTCRPSSEDIREQQMACSKDTRRIVSELIFIIGFILSGCKRNKENLIIACNITYKLINAEILEKELKSLPLQNSAPEYMIQSKIHPQVKRIIGDIKSTLGQQNSHNELDIFILFIQKVVEELEEELNS